MTGITVRARARETARRAPRPQRPVKRRGAAVMHMAKPPRQTQDAQEISNERGDAAESTSTDASRRSRRKARPANSADATPRWGPRAPGIAAERAAAKQRNAGDGGRNGAPAGARGSRKQNRARLRRAPEKAATRDVGNDVEQETYLKKKSFGFSSLRVRRRRFLHCSFFVLQFRRSRFSFGFRV